MSLVTDVCDAVVTAINGAGVGTYNKTFTARRAWLAKFQLKGEAAIDVVVVPAGMEEEYDTRDKDRHLVSVYVGILGKLADTATATVDAYALTGDQVRNRLRGAACRSLTAGSYSAFLESVEHGGPDTPVIAAEHLEQFQQATSVMKLNYLVFA